MQNKQIDGSNTPRLIKRKINSDLAESVEVKNGINCDECAKCACKISKKADPCRVHALRHRHQQFLYLSRAYAMRSSLLWIYWIRTSQHRNGHLYL